MSREDARTKGLRYLVEGRLVILSVSDDRIEATARGDGETYRLGFDLDRWWWCTCPAVTPRCAHLLALRSVTVIPRARADESTPAV